MDGRPGQAVRWRVCWLMCVCILLTVQLEGLRDHWNGLRKRLNKLDQHLEQVAIGLGCPAHKTSAVLDVDRQLCCRLRLATITYNNLGCYYKRRTQPNMALQVRMIPARALIGIPFACAARCVVDRNIHVGVACNAHSVFSWRPLDNDPMYGR